MLKEIKNSKPFIKTDLIKAQEEAWGREFKFKQKKEKSITQKP